MASFECVCRRSENQDQKAISTLISKCGGPSVFRKKFGSYNVAQLIESGYLSVTVVNSAKQREVLGFLTLNDNPRNYAHGSEKWMSFFRKSSSVSNANLKISNTLWIDFFVADETNSDKIYKNLFTTVFNTLSEIDYIVMCPPSGDTSVAKSTLFSDFTPDVLDFSGNSSTECQEFQEMSVFVCKR